MTIQGRGAERNLIYSSRRPRRRPPERPYERAGFKPDRVAMWAVLLGVLLILVAATSAHGANGSRSAIGSRAAAHAPAVVARSATLTSAATRLGALGSSDRR